MFPEAEVYPRGIGNTNQKISPDMTNQKISGHPDMTYPKIGGLVFLGVPDHMGFSPGNPHFSVEFQPSLGDKK